MRELPIIFSGPMVRALIAGRKTQTRRVLKSLLGQAVEPAWEAVRGDDGIWRVVADTPDYGGSLRARLPYDVGDRLWVREAHYLTDDGDYESAVYATELEAVAEHLAMVDRLMKSHPEAAPAWKRLRKLRPSIHMSRSASRLTLTVTEVRVQRLQEISEEDARAEGWPGNPEPPYMCHHPRLWFKHLWNSLHGPAAWDANPWVAAISFTVERRDIDTHA